MTQLLPAIRSSGSRSSPPWYEHRVEVTRYAVVRVSALEYPAERPEAASFRVLWRRWSAAERALTELAGPLADALYASAVDHSPDFHRKVILPLRRDVHNGRAPRAAVRIELGDLPQRLPALARWLAAVDDRERCRGELPAAVSGGLAADRQTLAALCSAEPLRNAVALTSHDLLRGLDRAATCGARPDARARKAEPNVLRYALRASSKTSPLSWFTYVGWGVWTGGPGELGVVAPVPHSTANRAVSMLLMRALTMSPDLRWRLPHRLAPAAEFTEERVSYRRDTPTGVSRLLVFREEQVTVASTAALRLMRSCVLAAGGPGATPEALAEALAKHLPGDPGRAQEAAHRYVDQLVSQQLFVPVEPLSAQRTDLLAALADWLEAHGRHDLGGPLRAIDDESRRFGRLGAHERPDALRRLSGAWQRMLGTVDLEPSDTTPVVEDVVLRHRVALGHRHGEQVRDDLTRLAPLAELFDTYAVLRRTLREQMVSRYGPGGTCRLADMVGEMAKLWSAVTRVDTDGTVDAGSPSSPPLPPELRELAELRRQVTQAARAIDPSGDEVELPDELVAEATASLPAWLLSRPASYAYFVQPFRRDVGDGGVGWCVNHIYAGWGRFSSRFLDLLDPEAAGEVGAQLDRVLGRGRVAQYRPVAGFNANLHPLLVADEVGEDPMSATLLIDDLELVHDPATDEVRIRIIGTGELVDVIYLGFLVPFAMPDRVAPLFMDLSAGATSFSHLASRTVHDVAGHRVTVRKRLRYRDVVLARRSWDLDPATVDALRGDLERDEEVPVSAAARWSVRLGLPDELFVTSVAGNRMSDLADFQRYLEQPKPQFVDLGSALHLRCLARLLARHDGGLRLEEALPAPGTSPAGRRTTELVVETYRWRDGS